MSSQALKAAATGAATPDQARNPFEALKRQLEAGKAEFLPLLGQNKANVDKFIRIVLNAVLSNPDLLECDRRSLLNAALKAAQDGLLPDGREAVLNIYNTKVSKRGEPDRWVKAAQYLPMVGGLIKKLYESGEVTYVDAACVYQNDRFKFTRGDNSVLEHEPTMDSDPGDIIAAYCVVKLKNGEVKREVMPRRDIDKVRNASKSKDTGPWVTWFDQQAIKSVIKRIYKQLPKADTFESVADADNLASGYTVDADSIGAHVRSHEAPPAAPALEHSEPDVLEHPVGEQLQRQAETVEGAAPDAPAEQQLAPAPDSAKPRQAKAAKGPTIFERIKACTDADTLDVMIDEYSASTENGPEREAAIAAYRVRRAEITG